MCVSALVRTKVVEQTIPRAVSRRLPVDFGSRAMFFWHRLPRQALANGSLCSDHGPGELDVAFCAFCAMSGFDRDEFSNSVLTQASKFSVPQPWACLFLALHAEDASEGTGLK